MYKVNQILVLIILGTHEVVCIFVVFIAIKLIAVPISSAKQQQQHANVDSGLPRAIRLNTTSQQLVNASPLVCAQQQHCADLFIALLSTCTDVKTIFFHKTRFYFVSAFNL